MHQLVVKSGKEVSYSQHPINYYFELLNEDESEDIMEAKIKSLVSESETDDNQMHLIRCVRTLHEFKYKLGRMPLPKNSEDAKKFIEIALELGFEFEDNNQTRFFSAFSALAATEYAPLCSMWGGIVSSEALKIVPKYSPINQWLVYEDLDYLTEMQQNRDIFEQLISGQDEYHNLAEIIGPKSLN